MRFCSCIYSNIFHQWSSKNWQNQTKNMMPILLSDWECLQFLTILYAFFRSLHLIRLCVAVILYVFTEQTQIRSRLDSISLHGAAVEFRLSFYFCSFFVCFLLPPLPPATTSVHTLLIKHIQIDLLYAYVSKYR